MSFRISVSGPAADAVRRVLPQLVADRVASRITGLDATLWGPEAESEASIRLGWTEAVAISRPLLPEIAELRAELRSSGEVRPVLREGVADHRPEVIA
jgi:glucose-6-phosphate isomerase